MGYIGSGVQRFNTADGLTVTGSAEINSLTYPTADGSNGQVLKTNGSGTLSFGTVSTDLVNDTSPQLGGDLQSNGNDIVIADTDNIYVGTSNDGLKIHHSNNNSFIEDVGTGNFLITTNGNNIQLMKNQAEQMLVAKTDGSVELYYDNSLKLDTQSHGARVNGGLRFASSGAASDTSNPYIFRTSGADDMVFATGSAERMRLTSAGLLGLGTASPSKLMHLYAGNDSASLRLENTANSKVWEITPANPGVANSGLSIYNVTDDAVAMHVNNSNNLLIGKTADSIANNGISAAGSATGGGHLSVTNDGNSCVTLNRKTSDGTIMSFATDGSTGGSIGVLSDRLCVGQSDVGLFFDATNNTITPFSFDTFDTIDNHIDLGIGSRRFQDIFASNGTIQTSDENEKQNIASLTSTEINAAKAISALFKTYKWKDAAASKGDTARIHTGVIAQEVQAAMSDAGLDAANYAFWCSDTWWETSTDVPAVEAVDEVLDEDGNVITEAVEAKDAYTRIDTYHTADEAPDGATQRTRMGIRYPELLAFIGAATEQRLTDIETRLAALEAGE